MNETLALIGNHRSDRSFSDRPVEAAVLDEIIQAVHRAPTSGNTQHVSLVVVQNPATRARIAELCGNQPWIAKAPVFITVVVDYYKTRQAMELTGQPHVIQEHIEGTISGVTDAGILLGQLIVAAHAKGLGIVPIGGVRNNPAEMIELLRLPQLVFPVAGLCLGYIDRPSQQRPRLPLETFRFDEEYGAPDMAASIKNYDAALLAHWARVGRSNGEAWTTSIAAYSTHNYRPKLMPALLRQGFRFDQD